MKLNEIIVGKVYEIKDNGMCLVIDIGRYDTNSSIQKKLVWNGVNITTTNWYQNDTDAQRSKIVFVRLNDPSRAYVNVCSPAVVYYEKTEDQVKQFFTDRASEAAVNQAIESQRKIMEDYANTVRSVISQIVKDYNPRNVGYYYNDNIWAQLAFSDVIQKMTVLWLKYHLLKGESICGEEDVESIIDTLADALKGLEATKVATDRDAIVQSVQATVQSSWTGFGLPKEVTA